MPIPTPVHKQFKNTTRIEVAYLKPCKTKVTQVNGNVFSLISNKIT